MKTGAQRKGKKKWKRENRREQREKMEERENIGISGRVVQSQKG
jgi:hypothetical protein